jgi:hypothetical protein
VREAPEALVPARLLRAAARLPWWVVSLAALALVIRLTLVGFGLPYELDPDMRDFVESAWRMIEQGRWDPRWYGHPEGTLMGVMALLYAGYAATGVAVGAFDGSAAVGQAYRSDVTDFFLMARVVTALSGTAVVLMTYALLRRIEASRRRVRRAARGAPGGPRLRRWFDHDPLCGARVSCPRASGPVVIGRDPGWRRMVRSRTLPAA